MVLLIVDTQQLITNDSLYQFDLFKENIKKLIFHARENDIEIIYVRHDDGKDQPLTKGREGYDVYDEFQPKENERIFDKCVNSPFKESGLLEYLKEKKISEIIVAGLQTEYCIDATIKCAFEHGFKVFVPAYANTTCDNEYMSGQKSYEYYNHFIWKKRYATCLSVESTVQMIKNWMINAGSLEGNEK